VFSLILLQISDDETLTEARQVGGSAEIRPGELMVTLSGTLSFMAVEDNDLEQPAQEQEEQHTTTIDFEFH
jgi:hypothetical protein